MTDTYDTDILDRALDQLARELNAGTGDLDTLAAKFLDVIEPGKQAEALLFLVTESIGMLIARCCLLDECDDNSYTVERAISAELADAITFQGRTSTALRELAAERIEQRARTIAVLAAAG